MSYRSYEEPTYLCFDNPAQGMMFQAELSGQISDGAWENTNPQDHWRPWCHAEVRIVEPGQPVGRTFYADKDNYDFARHDLWSIPAITVRMKTYVAAARIFPTETTRWVHNQGYQFPDNLEQYGRWLTRDYSQFYLKAFFLAGFDYTKMVTIENASDQLTDNDLVSVLRSMKPVVRIKIDVTPALKVLNTKVDEMLFAYGYNLRTGGSQ